MKHNIEMNGRRIYRIFSKLMTSLYNDVETVALSNFGVVNRVAKELTDAITIP